MAMKLTPISDRFKRLLPAVILLAAGTLTTAAQADIFGYVDAAGDTHFSTEKLDARYQLFMKGDRSFDASELTQPVMIEPAAMQSNLFKVLTQHPNLKKYDALLTSAASEYKVDPALMKAMMAAESGFNPQAVSPKGAVGLMQIMPATAERYGVAGDAKTSIQKKLTDPTINVRLAARYLRDLNRLFPNQQALVIASYNAGEGAVQRYRNTIPPFAETRNYVQLVTQFYHFYAGDRAPVTRIKSVRSNGNGGGNGNDDRSSNRIHLTIPGRATAGSPTVSAN